MAKKVTRSADVGSEGPTPEAKKSPAELHEERVAKWLAAKRAQAAEPEAPREGWIEVRTANAFGDVVSRQVPARLHQSIVMWPSWRPGASLHASAAFLSYELNSAAEADPGRAAELVPLAEIAGLAYLATLRFERGTLTEKDRKALRDAANTLRRGMEPERVNKSAPAYFEGPLPPRDPNEEPHVGPSVTLPCLNRRDRMLELLAMADPELHRPSRARLAKHPGGDAFEVWVHSIAVVLIREIGPRCSTVSEDKKRMDAFKKDVGEKVKRASYRLDKKGNPEPLAEVTRENDKAIFLAAALRHFEGMTAKEVNQALKSLVR